MVLNNQKLLYFIKNKIFKIMTHSWKRIRSKKSEMHTDHTEIHCSFIYEKYIGP